MFKIEGERGLFMLYEPSDKGDVIVSYGDKKLQCFLRSENIGSEECKDIPSFFDYANCSVSYIENPIGWNPSWDKNKKGAA